MGKIRVKLDEQRHIYIHNDLSNAAFYFKQRIYERIKADDREGISLEIMACLTMIAFAVEAKINFLGYRLIPNYPERAPYWEKVKKVTSQLGVKFDNTTRPYKTIASLKDFRDTLAHGKPLNLNASKEVVTTHEELEQRGYLTAHWEAYITPGFVEEAFDDMEEIWRDLLARSKLEIFDTLTHGGSSITFLEAVE